MRRVRRRRRGAGGTRRYSIGYLLSRQPVTVTRHPSYPALLAHFNNASRLQTLRFPRRCYSLLHNARVAPENLHHFYRTYRLPAHPFFPLFFQVKRDYLRERERKREERHRFILESMRTLPPPILAFVKYLGRLEQHYAGGARCPIWQKYLFPGTKKQVRSYLSYGELQWLETFRVHLGRLEREYRAFNHRLVERALACFVLGIPPGGPPPRRPPAAEVSSAYRRQSMRFHPDRGGDGRLFVELEWARQALRGD
ncbi:MAG: hypothetical protein ACLFRR_05165 [Spirochaetaceae bacterium]